MTDSAPLSLDVRSPPELNRGGADAHADASKRVLKQQAALFEMMRAGVMGHTEQEVLSVLTETTARTLNVARVSIWRFNADFSQLELQDLYESATNRHSSGGALEAVRYPSYFEALKHSRVVSATDARRDPRTVEFLDHYLIPLDIHSLLDAGVWVAGSRHGVVCVESVGGRRGWTPDEQQFCGSIADLVVIARENETRRSAQTELTASVERFTRVFRLSPDLMVVTRASDGVVVDVNEGFERQTGYLRADTIGRTMVEMGLWAIQGQRESWVREVCEHGRVRGLEVELRMRDGEIRTYQISAERCVIEGEECIISISRDFTAAKRHERIVFEIAQGVAAATGESFFRSLVERLQLALDADVAFVGELDQSSATGIRTIAVHTRAGVGLPFRYDLDGSPCETILSSGVCAYPCDVAQLFPRDTALAEKQIQGYVGAPLMSADGVALGLISVMFKQPIEHSEMAVQLMRIFATRASAELERRDQLAELEFRANHDLLTRLPNRPALEGRIDATLAAARPDGRAALLLLDLDRFKEVNDTLGHRVGDKLIEAIARRIRADAPSGLLKGCEFARTGGDEFAAWIPYLDSTESLVSIAAELRHMVTSPVEVGGYRLEVGASVGIALFPAHANTASELLRCAEIAMYQAKRHGSAITIYDRASDPYSTRRLALMSELSAAVRDQQLEVFYQPRTVLATGMTAGFEALVRWRHPQHGLIMPSQFVPLAELSDVIRALTLNVLDQALRQLQAWQQRGHSMSMSVNLSARNLMDPECGDQIEALLTKHAVRPDSLELEITESAIIADPDRATATLSRLHDLGVRIAIDDFGTGYSSLSHLRRLPLDALKIDVSFVTNMLKSEQDAAIVASTIGLAHSLGLTVVAEGIEDASTQTRLSELGCEEGQGFHISAPMPSIAATDWLEASRR